MTEVAHVLYHQSDKITKETILMFAKILTHTFVFFRLLIMLYAFISIRHDLFGLNFSLEIERDIVKKQPEKSWQGYEIRERKIQDKSWQGYEIMNYT